jgi:O-antigen/teichoic acid export membrane protein
MAIEEDPQTAELICVLSVALVGRAMTQWTRHAFTAYETARVSLYLHAVYRPLEVFAGLMLVWLGGGVIGVVCLHTASWWLEAITAIVIVNRRLTITRWHIAWDTSRWLLARGLPICLGALLTYWLLQGSMILFKHSKSTGASLGQFGLVMTAFSLVASTVGSFGAASIPVLSRSVERSDGKDTLYVEMLLRVFIFFGAAGALFLSATGPWLTHRIFGAAYSEAGAMLGTMAWISILWACGSILWTVFMADSRLMLPLVLLTTGAGVMTLSLPSMAASWGAFGALLANGLGIAVWAVGFAVLFASAGKMRFGYSVLQPAGSATVAFLTNKFISPGNPGASLGLAMAALIFSTVLFKGLTYKEVSVFGSFFRQMFFPDRDNQQM